MKELRRIPVIYAVLLGLIIRGLNIAIPEPIIVPIHYIYDGYIGIALLIFGFCRR